MHACMQRNIRRGFAVKIRSKAVNIYNSRVSSFGNTIHSNDWHLAYRGSWNRLVFLRVYFQGSTHIHVDVDPLHRYWGRMACSMKQHHHKHTHIFRTNRNYLSADQAVSLEVGPTTPWTNLQAHCPPAKSFKHTYRSRGRACPTNPRPIHAQSVSSIYITLAFRAGPALQRRRQGCSVSVCQLLAQVVFVQLCVSKRRK